MDDIFQQNYYMLDSLYSASTTFSSTLSINLGLTYYSTAVFSLVPRQTSLGYQLSNRDMGIDVLPIYAVYNNTPDYTHICNSAATGVYLILLGGGGGGGSGGADEYYSGDGGGGGGGGALLAVRINLDNNSTITTPITLTVVVGEGGAGGPGLGSNGLGNAGTTGGTTSVTIACSGNDIVCKANGGVGGTGGLANNEQTTPGGAGGTASAASISLSGGAVNYSYLTTIDGQTGGAGADGTGSDTDISPGGTGGNSAYEQGIDSTTFTISNFPYLGGTGYGGNGGDGDSENGNRTGEPGSTGVKGIVYIFEYFD